MDSLLSLFIDSAWAQIDGGTAGSLSTLLFPIALIVVFYLLLIRPQQKKQKDHRQMVEAVGAGDEVVTGGGIIGKVTEVGEQFLTVEIGDGISVKVQRHTIAAVLPKGTVKHA